MKINYSLEGLGSEFIESLKEEWKDNKEICEKWLPDLQEVIRNEL